MSENKTPEQIAAEALNQNWEEDATYERLGERVIDDLRAAGLLASSPTGDYRKLEDQIADTLAYYQCRETNPKADHPSMGYHAFSEEQREWLRDKKREAAAEIVRMMRAGAVSPTGDERDKLTLIARDVHLYGGGPHLSLLGLDAQRIADAILAAGFRLVNTDSENTVTTIEELQRLNYGSIIQEGDEAPKILRYSESGERWWENPMRRSEAVGDKWISLPAKVLYRKGGAGQ